MSKATFSVAAHIRQVGMVEGESPSPFGSGRYQRLLRAYMADAPILCAHCRCLITPLSAFTTARRAGESASRPRPICWTCRPFRVGKSAA